MNVNMLVFCDLKGLNSYQVYNLDVAVEDFVQACGKVGLRVAVVKGQISQKDSDNLYDHGPFRLD